MAIATIEHVNLTVTNPHKSARFFSQLCGWNIRWEGPSMTNGYTVHVGSEKGYFALYTNDKIKGDFSKGEPLNHVGVQVDDLAAARKIVVATGFEPFSEGTYEEGPSSFYFFDWDGIEFEVVSYR